MIKYAMLCYVMLCYAMLCYAMLCYVMLCYVMVCMYVCPLGGPAVGRVGTSAPGEVGGSLTSL